MTLLIRTSDLVPSERFEFWRSAVSEMFVPLRTDAARPERFDGSMRGFELGALKVAEVAAGPHVVRRTGALIARSDPGHYKLGVQLRGYCVLTQDGREAPLVPRDLAVYDTTRPYTLAFDDAYRQLVLMFPRRLLRLPDEAVAGITATRISGRRGLGAVLSPFLAGLAGHLDELDGRAAVRLADNVLDLLVTLLAERLDVAAPAAGTRGALLVRARAYIERHLGDPDLGPDRVAAAHHVSTRYLYKIFQDEGTTVSAWIRQRRLEHCRRDLRDPLQLGRPVSAIAAGWGFVDAARFSRLFKAAYGASPREYRRGGGPGAR
ncbi:MULTISPECIES: helix-turn-helix domain-containing protein [Actinomadura]|uniref:Helix-turn-helix domain-containing protein n=1 Tax=Actinomadura yumaensis TaxID=111807 RepID=A0ABW2CNG4_9ACTN|nr:helix-turn-helix domain-containing protein [Actinomadura sp. J1-007]MWK36893.1 helix-turn-helix domain-containing protein [Actinomadura sp. J1-007]